MARPRTVRSNAEMESRLPRYKVKVSKDFPDWLMVWCPREDCPSQKRKEPLFFMVHKAIWLKPLISTISGVALVGRSCPYCYKTGKIPGK